MKTKNLNNIADFHVSEISTDDLARISGGGDNLFTDLGIAVGRGIVKAGRWIYDATSSGYAWGY